MGGQFWGYTSSACEEELADGRRRSFVAFRLDGFLWTRKESERSSVSCQKAESWEVGTGMDREDGEDKCNEYATKRVPRPKSFRVEKGVLCISDELGVCEGRHFRL